MSTQLQAETTYFAFIDGWNRRDAAAMAACFTPEGALIGFDGSLARGAREVQDHLAPIFRDHPTPPYVAQVDEVRPVTPEMVLLRAEVGMTPPAETRINPALNAYQTCLLRQIDGAWRIEFLQTTPAAFHGRPDLVAEMTARLQDVRDAGAEGGSQR